MATNKEIEESLRNGALNIITAVKYDLDMLNAINHMTFLFDPNWQGTGNTLPISFFFVKSFQEVMTSDVSQKTLLFYNSQKASNQYATSGGLLGTVADNVINKPKKYQMQILIPRTIAVYLKQAVFSKRVDWLSLYGIPGATGVENASAITETLLLNLMSALGSGSFRKLLDGGINIKSFISESLSGFVDDSNKASLDAMWENRTILRMKYWNGWNFKYVTIENYTPSKVGEEDDYYEATLNLTELPILTARREGAGALPEISKANTLSKLTASSLVIDKLSK